MITCIGASKSFETRRLWQDVDLTVGDGEMVALVGPSGSGKSTLLNCIGLLDDLDGGSIVIDGAVLTEQSDRRRRLFRKRHLGYLFQNYALIESADGGEIRVDGSDITRFGRGARRRFRRDSLGYLFQNYALIDNATVSANLDAAVAASGVALRRRRRGYGAALGRVGLAGREREKIYRLSGGEQQRVALARLLVKEPTLILADEPTGALDEENEAMVMEALRDMSGQGATVIVATHREQVRAGCDSLFEVGGR